MTLLEIIIVVALVAALFTAALPDLGIVSETKVSSKLGLLSADIRRAFDFAVLNGRPYRLAFHLASGDYWLEESEQEEFKLPDPSVEDEFGYLTPEEKKEAFESSFEQYTELAGDPINDPDSEIKIEASSPVILAKDKLGPNVWYKVKDPEWRGRSLGPELIIKDVQIEGPRPTVSIEGDDPDQQAYLYILPAGYIDRAAIHIFYRRGEYSLDTQQKPYTVFTRPHRGEAVIYGGERDIEESKEEDRL